MKYLTDATWTIDLLNGQPQAVTLLPQLLADGLALSTLTYMEVFDGIYTSRDPKQAAAGFRQFLRAVTVFPFSRRVAQRAARLRGNMRAQKLRLEHRAIDILVAATALELGLTMVTSDTDYDDIPGLTRLNPRTGELVTHP
jgi:tRNA(fMet)-specific endonuclease VapC